MLLVPWHAIVAEKHIFLANTQSGRAFLTSYIILKQYPQNHYMYRQSNLSYSCQFYVINRLRNS
jgi:hypothetical protein